MAPEHSSKSRACVTPAAGRWSCAPPPWEPRPVGPPTRPPACRQSMTLPPYWSTALWAHQRFHGHAAIVHCERMTVSTRIPMASARELSCHGRVHLPFLFIVDRGIENHIFEHSINVRNFSEYTSGLTWTSLARHLGQVHVLLCLREQGL